MKMKSRVMLSTMMFLQYAAWGAWMPVIGATIGNRFGAETGTVVAGVFSALWLGCIFAPFAGQLADRLMPGQVFLGIRVIKGKSDLAKIALTLGVVGCLTKFGD